MEKAVTTILRTLAGLCAVLFVIAAGVTLLVFNAERRLFDAQSYLAAFEEQHLYDQIPALAADALISNQSAAGQEVRPPEAMSSFSAEDWQSVVRAVLPPELTRTLIGDAVTAVFDVLNGKTESATLSLTALKTYLTSPSAAQALAGLLRSQPPCTPEQILQMAASGFTGTPALFLCNPSEQIINAVQPIMRMELRTIAAAIPETATIISADALAANQSLATLRTIRTFMRFSPLLPLGLLFLITVFAVRSWKDWCYWWGFPIFFGGALGLALSIVIQPIFQWIFNASIAPRFPAALPTTTVDISRNLIRAVLGNVTAPVVFQSIVLLFLGTILVLSARLKLRGPSKPPSQDTEGEVPA